jgi:chromosome segregation ATPase
MADYVTSEEMLLELKKLAKVIGVGVSELYTELDGEITVNRDAINAAVAEINAVKTRMASAESRLDAIDVIDENDNITSIAEKVKTLNNILSEDGTLAADVLQRIASNNEAIGKLTTDLADEVARATQAEGNLGERVDDLEAGLSTANASIQANATEISGVKALAQANEVKRGDLDDLNTVAKDSIVSAVNEVNGKIDANAASIGDVVNEVSTLNTTVDNVKSRVTANETAIATLNGDENTDGSVAKKIKTAVTQVKTELSATDQNLQDQIDDLKGSGSGSLGELQGRVEVVENVLNDTTDANGNLVKGLKTRVSDVETAVSTEETRATQAEAGLQSQIDNLQGSGLIKGVISGLEAGNIFMAAVGLIPIKAIDDDLNVNRS